MLSIYLCWYLVIFDEVVVWLKNVNFINDYNIVLYDYKSYLLIGL